MGRYGNNSSRYQKQQKRSYQSGSQSARRIAQQSSGRKESALKAKLRVEGDVLDANFGFQRYEQGPPRLGWLMNMLPTSTPNEVGREESGLDLYFLEQDGSTFKVTFYHQPYFYVVCSEEKYLADTTLVLNRRFENMGMSISIVEKEDLDLPNHLSGKLHRILKLSFQNVSDLMDVRRELNPILEANKKRASTQDAYKVGQPDEAPEDFLETLIDMREYDVPYYVRVCIDCDVRVGGWYIVTPQERGCSLSWQKDMVVKAEPKVLAFDIECTKAPLKFPRAEVDQVFMISYMIDGKGYLIISRDVVSEDIENFEYTPKPSFKGPFHVFNEKNEEATIRRFFDHCKDEKPHIYVTYNGDFFDWPFLEARALVYGIDMARELGISKTDGNEYRGRCSVHLDAFCWVQRDSYLPCGARGLKAVTKYKLGYDPVEVDAEDMVPLARSNPTEMAAYSVSDAVATYYLYQTYVHLFIYSLCTVIPMGPEDVLRKGSGTLCESLLMVEAFKVNVLCPNKQKDALTKFHEGHLVETETYVGGHVEALESGVFRSDIPAKFRLEPSALQGLIDNIDRDLTFAVEVEDGTQRSDIINYDEVRNDIIEKLENLRDTPNREEEPFVYHLDVAAMYPNIILTNRLQPNAIVTKHICAACDFNQAGNDCKRAMEWVWRGDYSPATQSEYAAVKNQLMYETVEGQPFSSQSASTQAKLIKARLKDYSNKVYRKTKITEEKVRTDVTCMRENPMYVDTVRAFRDRRYDYKLLTKKWKKEVSKAAKAGDAVAEKQAKDKELLYDSLQLAHKCILNSFYGYVMRKGARWRSMEMAGIVTYTGANLITQARQLVEQIGRPLELDTDGIWCILPSSFPENYFLKTKSGGKIFMSYPGLMLNADVHKNYTNHQYQDLLDPNLRSYSKKSECSIFFEVDGPYRCMVIPSSTEEGKLLKKRYAVFNFDGSLAELKGFELKRRGELELIKTFQSEIFELFLNGTTLEECYASVAKAANNWLDVLDSKGADLSDEELIDLISENRTISKTLEEYEGQKGTSLTSAARLADFLGDEMVKDAGLNCKLIISCMPYGAPVAERAVPVAIFSTEEVVMKHYLRKWLKRPQLNDFDIRSLLDWDYYWTRLANNVMKIITIPAALQKVPNPVPRVKHPDWLDRIVREKEDSRKQLKIDQLFGPKVATVDKKKKDNKKEEPILMDIEDTASGMSPRVLRPVVHKRVMQKKQEQIAQSDQENVPPTDLPKENESEQQMNAPVEKAPSRDEDFEGWMSFKKDQWRKWRKHRKQKKQHPSTSSRHGTQQQKMPRLGASGLRGFLREGANSVLQSYWQVIEISETFTPGEFVVWAMTGPQDLQKMRLTVPRVFYLNSKVPNQDQAKSGGRAVSKFLPHSQPCLHLYEYEVPEHRIQRNEKGLANFLSHPDVQGVYELGTPLLFKALLQLGCVCQVTQRRKEMGLDPKSQKFDLEDLEMVATTTHPFLHPSTALFKRIYFYHTQIDRRAITGMFVVSGDNSLIEPERNEEDGPVKATAQVWITNPYENNEVRPPLSKIYETFAQVAGSTCKFALKYAKSTGEALASANASLTRYLQGRNGPTVVLSQTLGLGSTLLQLRRTLPALNDFPLIAMPGNAADSDFPALGWQAFAAQRLIQRFLLSADWFRDRLLCARYAHLPVSNIGDDAPVRMADTFFARLLQHNRQLLWCSETTKPDLGGIESDENLLWSEELESPNVLQPGTFRCVCVELGIFGLAVNSIMASTNLEALEGAGAVTQGKGGVGDDAAIVPSFRLLKALVGNWLHDVSVTGNAHADALLVHCYRWLCSREALLADPSLHRTTHALMTKVFLRLIAELRRLGARVVFANFQKIIIATQKTDVVAAHEYVDFVVNTVCARDIFQCLQVEPQTYWESLLFMDEENYGGIQIDVDGDSPDTAEEEAKAESPNKEVEGDSDNEENEEEYRQNELADNEEHEEELASGCNEAQDSDMEEGGNGNFGDSTGQAPHIVSHWNISEFLPSAVREYFLLVIGELLYRPREEADRLRKEKSNALLQLSQSQGEAKSLIEKSSAKGHHGTIEEEVAEEVQTYLKKLVSTHFTKKLLAMTTEILKYDTGPDSFPVLPGSHRSLTNPALEFIKSICKVLSLDPSLDHEVQVMRRSLLVSIGTREFDQESIFQDPCASFILPDVICSFCNLCKDIDLCRDPCVLGEKEDRWKCIQCSNSYDVKKIELQLIEIIERLITRYQLQDLRCNKCNMVFTRRMSLHCPCSGMLVCDISPETFEKDINTLFRIAKYHGFEWVEQTIEGILPQEYQT